MDTLNTVCEVSQLMGLTPMQVQHLVSKGKIATEYDRLGNEIKIRDSEMQRILEDGAKEEVRRTLTKHYHEILMLLAYGYVLNEEGYAHNTLRGSEYAFELSQTLMPEPGNYVVQTTEYVEFLNAKMGYYENTEDSLPNLLEQVEKYAQKVSNTQNTESVCLRLDIYLVANCATAQYYKHLSFKDIKPMVIKPIAVYVDLEAYTPEVIIEVYKVLYRAMLKMCEVSPSGARCDLTLIEPEERVRLWKHFESLPYHIAPQFFTYDYNTTPYVSSLCIHEYSGVVDFSEKLKMIVDSGFKELWRKI